MDQYHKDPEKHNIWKKLKEISRTGISTQYMFRGNGVSNDFNIVYELSGTVHTEVYVDNKVVSQEEIAIFKSGPLVTVELDTVPFKNAQVLIKIFK